MSIGGLIALVLYRDANKRYAFANQVQPIVMQLHY